MAVQALSTVPRAGVTAHMKGLAREVGAQRITVNCVAPALIDTSHREGPQPTRKRRPNVVRRSRRGRMGTQEQRCAVVAFLASRQAGFITGSTIAVEGDMVGSLF